jgi:hypothetical protein
LILRDLGTTEIRFQSVEGDVAFDANLAESWCAAKGVTSCAETNANSISYASTPGQWRRPGEAKARDQAQMDAVAFE